jgi:hypothetical protein
LGEDEVSTPVDILFHLNAPPFQMGAPNPRQIMKAAGKEITKLRLKRDELIIENEALRSALHRILSIEDDGLGNEGGDEARKIAGAALVKPKARP